MELQSSQSIVDACAYRIRQQRTLSEKNALAEQQAREVGSSRKGARLPEELGQHDPRRQRHGRPRRLQQRAPSATAVRNEELWAAVRATATTIAEGKGLVMVMEASARVLVDSGLLQERPRKLLLRLGRRPSSGALLLRLGRCSSVWGAKDVT